MNISSQIDAAIRLMNEGRHGEADMLVADMLAEQPRDVDARLLRAAIILKQGAVEDAHGMLVQLAGEVPERADVVANLGATHAALGRPEEASASFEQAVLLDPENALRRGELARMLLMLGEHDRARTEIVRMQELALSAEDATLMAEGWATAAALFILEDDPARAEAAVRTALELRPGHGDDIALLAGLLAHQARFEEALPFAEQAYRAAPAQHERAVLLAGCLMEAGRLAEAERIVRRVVAVAAGFVPAQMALARILIRRGDTAGGLAAFAPLVRQAGQTPEMLVEMARLLRLGGDLGKALLFADNALKQAPDSLEAGLLRSHLLRALGRVEEAWPTPAAPIPHEAWGATPLVVPEGLPAEEVVLLARFARHIVPEGARRACYAEAALAPLLEGFAGLAPMPLPAPEEACPLPALPDLLGVSAEDLAAESYLAVEAERYAEWGEALSALPRPLVGMMWESGPEAGPPLDALANALSGKGTLISLVFDKRREQLRGREDVVDAGARFADARDLIACVAHLDLVCGADGLALHVAGALGREGMVAVPPALPWIWANREGRSLWYRGIEVFRPAKVGDWDVVLREMREAVARRLAGGTGDVGSV